MEEYRIHTWIWTTAETQSYSFIDSNIVLGKYSYRFKQFDLDGSYKYSDIVVVELIQPIQFKLEQNYPNPFNPSTRINYQIRFNGFVSLKIHNVLRKEIAIIVNEVKDAGDYEINFDAEGLQSGIYFYTLKTGHFLKTI